MIVRTAERNQSKQIKAIEYHLRHFHSYKTGIKNLRMQLDYMLPNITTSYEYREGSTGVFEIRSSTEQAVLDRLESKKALDIHEKIEGYQIVVNSIEKAMEVLDQDEVNFLVNRYFKNWSMNQTAEELGYSERTIMRLRNRVFKKLLISLSSILF